MTEELKKQFQSLENQIKALKSEIGVLKKELSELTSQFFTVRSVSGTIMQSSRIAELLIERIAQDANYKLRSGLFEKRIQELIDKGFIPNEIIGSGFHSIRILANKVRHYKEKTQITYYDAETILRNLYRIIEWYYCEYPYGPKLPTIYSSPEETEKIDVRIKNLAKDWSNSGKFYPDKLKKDVLIELEKLEKLPKLPKDAYYLLLMIALHNGHNWIFWFENAKALPECAFYLVKVIDEGFMRPQYRAGYCLQLLPESKRNEAIKKYYGQPQPPDYLKEFYAAINDGKLLETLKAELYTTDGSRKDKIRILLREFRNFGVNK